MSLSLISGSIHICAELRLRQSPSCLTISSSRPKFLSSRSKQFSLDHFPQISRPIKVIARSAMETTAETITGGVPNNTMKLLFVEMGVGYDQHGQDVTSAAMKACSIPGVSFGEMKLQIKLGVPHSLHQQLDLDKVKSIFPYGKIVNVEVVDGGLICSSGVLVEEMGDTNEDCYIVNVAVYVGY
ncbi:50S ribosomal protein L34 [Arabidopsis thaliana]|uniref:50S ribosomal protein L34 n=1 Tax=Arabidopsis thaliana TaxID=3702 RepID=F4HZV3_ARATH|nr:50S ribosomal protein L34 [Arabidopsis thaliana]AEE31032.1 50S ribosomal protein L34 [Arabidopsis thaliana]|eukprot:NP_849726.1 50S ribosomal protein L34 [Arabidopsis thaliana]